MKKKKKSRPQPKAQDQERRKGVFDPIYQRLVDRGLVIDRRKGRRGKDKK